MTLLTTTYLRRACNNESKHGCPNQSAFALLPTTPMTSTAVLLVGRRTNVAREVFGAHADELRRREVADAVHVATFETEPVRELRGKLAAIDADRVYAVPMCVAHTGVTIDDLPAALSYVPGEVHYGEPLGQSPVVTDVVSRTATALVPAAEDASLVLVANGSSSTPYHRQTTEYHATRLREQSAYGEVETCYLLQNPAAECVRYSVTNSRSVAVPLFVARCEATDEKIPEKLELERGGIEYADPFGTHDRITDAIHAEVEKQRVLADESERPSASFEASLTRRRLPVATDGEGTVR